MLQIFRLRFIIGKKKYIERVEEEGAESMFMRHETYNTHITHTHNFRSFTYKCLSHLSRETKTILIGSQVELISSSFFFQFATKLLFIKSSRKNVSKNKKETQRIANSLQKFHDKATT